MASRCGLIGALYCSETEHGDGMERSEFTLTASDQEEADIRAVQLIRGAIITAYAQVEFLLADLYLRARCIPEYAHLDNRFTYRL